MEGRESLPSRGSEDIGGLRSPGTGEGGEPSPQPSQAEKAGGGMQGFPVGTTAVWEEQWCDTAESEALPLWEVDSVHREYSLSGRLRSQASEGRCLSVCVWCGVRVYVVCVYVCYEV